MLLMLWSLGHVHATILKQGWRSGESARLSLMYRTFDSRTRRHVWVEFFVSALPCSESEVFLRVLRFSPLLKKPTCSITLSYIYNFG